MPLITEHDLVSVCGKKTQKNYKMHNKNNIEAICHIHNI